MSSTNKTTYYDLPQFVDNDIFNPLVDDNDAYDKIDTALHNIADAEADDASEIVGIKSRLDSAEGDIDALEAQNGDSVLTTTAQTLSGAVNELDADVSALDGRLDIVEDDINNASTGLKAKVSALETQNGNETLDTTSQTLSGAINELNKGITFVTPEMYGAVGDGVTDDTTALQAMFNAKLPVYMSRRYKTSVPILINNVNRITIDASSSQIIYDGNDYAVIIEKCQNMDFYFGTISATAGSCIKLQSLTGDGNDNIQYVNFHFKFLRALHNCIYGEIDGNGWINEVRFYDGLFEAGEVGCKINKIDGSLDTGNWNFYSIGIEGVDTGFYFVNTSSDDRAIMDNLFVGLRYSEHFDTLFKTEGIVKDSIFIGACYLDRTKLDLSNQTTNIRFITNILNTSNGMYAYVYDGKLMRDGISLALNGGYPIEANDDLNSLLTIGNYYAASGAIANSLSNSPTHYAFSMIVVGSNGSSNYGVYRYLKQMIIDTNDCIYMRSLYTEDSGATYTFNDWIALHDKSLKYNKFEAGIELQANTDITTLEKGRYYCPSNAVMNTLTGIPSGYVAGAFELDVYPCATSNSPFTSAWATYIQQITDSLGNMYIRTISSDGTAGNYSAGNWNKVNMTTIT